MARIATIIALTLAAAAALAACGEEDADLLPGETAREITANLDAVQQLADEGDCLGAEAAAEQVAEQVEAVQGVDRRLQQALLEGAERLNEVVARCEEEQETVEPPEEETEEDSEADQEKERERAEKEREKEEKEREKEEERAQKEREAEEEEQEEDDEPDLPPPAEGEGKGPEGGPPGLEGDSPSGGVGPGSAVGGEG